MANGLDFEITADALLKTELDKALKKFKLKNPSFFNEYTSARMIIDLRERQAKKDAAPPPAK